jgi:uroporphyrinogen-III decarboxylase
MDGKSILLRAIRGEKTPRVAWIPFSGCHGGALIEKTATEYLRSETAIVEGIGEVISRYRPDGVPVMFDLQIEAEVLGCDLAWNDETPPGLPTLSQLHNCSHRIPSKIVYISHIAGVSPMRRRFGTMEHGRAANGRDRKI